MDFRKLGSSRIKGSIDAQWQSNLAVERILIGARDGASGLTELLSTLEFIGYILLVVYSVFLICFLLLIQILLGLVAIYKAVKYRNANKTLEQEVEADDGYQYELSDEDIEELENYS